MESAYRAAMKRQESETEPPIPLSEFTEQAMRFSMFPVMASTLTNLGFECRQRTPDFRAIARFLGERYKYWTDDIPHPDPFAAPAEQQRAGP